MKKTLSPQALETLEKVGQFLSLGQYSPYTIRNYLSALRYLFVYFTDVNPLDFREDMIMQYLLYLTRTLGGSREKCRMAAQRIVYWAKFLQAVRAMIDTGEVILPKKTDAKELLWVYNLGKGEMMDKGYWYYESEKTKKSRTKNNHKNFSG